MSNAGESDAEGAALAPRALVAGHGEFAIGIVSAVEQITGRGGVLVALTNRGLGADEIVRTLRDAVVSAGAHVIFTDLPAGSWTIAARRVQRDRPDVVVVTGANLPALLDFVFQTTARTTRRRATQRTRGAARWSCWGAAEGAPAVPIELFRIDDRLIHGQVVVGWGQPLDVGFIVLVDDEVATSEWEQELYRLGVPPGMDGTLRDRRRGRRPVSRGINGRAPGGHSADQGYRDDAAPRGHRAAAFAASTSAACTTAPAVCRSCATSF